MREREFAKCDGTWRAVALIVPEAIGDVRQKHPRGVTCDVSRATKAGSWKLPS